MDTQINLFSKFTPPKQTAKARFKERLQECQWLKACTAYWTLQADYFGKDLLAQVLKRKDSFFCVHFEHPTNWRHLKELQEKNANIFIHYWKWEKDNSINIRGPLLHAKVNLFGLADNKAEIWIGSYNMTNKALTDRNIEAVTIIQTTQDTAIYKQVLDFLEKAKGKCEPFEEQRFLAYEMSRRQNLLDWKEEFAKLFNIDGTIRHIEREYVIWLAGFGLADLHTSRTVLQLICMDTFLQPALNRLQKTVLLEVWDADKKNRYYYRASVQLSAILDKNKKETYKIKLPPTRYAIIQEGMIGGILNKAEVLEEKHLKQGKLMATVVVEEQLTNIQLYAYPKFWKTIPYGQYARSSEKIHTAKGESKEQVQQLILDNNALDKPEQIQVLSRKKTEALLSFYRSQEGQDHRKLRPEMTDVSFIEQETLFHEIPDLDFEDARRDKKNKRLIIGIDETTKK